MRSSLRRGLAELTPQLRLELRAHAAARIWAYLVTDAAEMSINAPMNNAPKAEVFLNTKGVLGQFSMTARAARAAPQGAARVCVGCHDATAAVPEPRGACCHAGGGACAGCPACVGRLFHCPVCDRRFAMRWAYETGSGVGSIGRNPSRFAVHDMPATLRRTLRALEASRSVRADAPRYDHNHCVGVVYTGALFCAGCALGGGCAQYGGSKKCHSVLNLHQDRGGGANSQGVSANVTVSVGDARTLLHQLCDARDATRWPLRGNPPARFTLTDGSVFELHPDDETSRPREDAATGECVPGTYKHGVLDPVAEAGASAAYVFRQVTAAREVDAATDFVIMTREQARAFAGSPRAQKYADARAWWKARAAAYAAHVATNLRFSWVGEGEPRPPPKQKKKKKKKQTKEKKDNP